jgi:acyl dehydratase
MMAMHIDAVRVGESRSEVVVENLSRAHIAQYAGASGDFSPQHVDEAYNTEVAGYPSVFAHGMLTMGMTGRMITNWFGAGMLTKFGVRFVRPVWPGDTLTTTAVIEAIHADVGLVDLAVTTATADGAAVVVGYATARIDR